MFTSSRALAALAVLLVATACTTQLTDRPSQDGPLPDTAYPAMTSGTIYLLVGKPASGNVWRVDLPSRASAQLTHNRAGFGISWLSASAAGLVLADAASGIDDVSVYRDHRSTDLAGHGVTPVISPTGSVAYVPVPDTGASWSVVERPASGGSAQIRYQQGSPDLGALAFGPDNQLAVISGPSSAGADVLVFTGNTTQPRTIDPGISTIGFLVWGAKAPGIAVGDLAGYGELIDPGSNVITPLPGHWTPECWSPDGSRLVVSQGDRLGIWQLAASERVDDLGVMSGAAPLTGCSWLTGPAAGA